VTLRYQEERVRKVEIKYFDTIPVANALVVMRAGPRAPSAAHRRSWPVVVLDGCLYAPQMVCRCVLMGDWIPDCPMS